MMDPTADGRPRPAPPCHPHRFRSVRDANGRELGGLCLPCGELLHYRGGVELLRAASLIYLLREESGEVVLGDRCRRRLQATRRRLARQAAQEAEG
jgi:hypothetical protein